MNQVARRILIVEDEDDIREILKEFFEGEGDLVSTAVNGADAFRVLKETGKPDLILVDLMMPVMSGEEFIEQKKMDPSYSTVPVVIMSADHRTKAKAAALGIKWAINKPLELSALISIVDEAIRESV